MHIYHDENGKILWTAEYGDGVTAASGAHIIVDDPITDIDRWIVRNRELIAVTEITEGARMEAIAAVNRLRGETRARFITVLPGQDMVYLDKERAALACLADPDPDPDDYPGLIAEVGVTGGSLYEVAQIVANLAAYWRGVSAQIENVAMTAIGAISEASTFDQADAAVATARQGMEGIG